MFLLTITVKSCQAQVPVSLAPVPVQQFSDRNGTPLANGKLYSYAAGTNTLQATYRDSTGVAQNTNPLILDSNGRGQIWLARLSYKLVLQNAAGQQIWSVDNVKDGALSLLTSDNTWLGHNIFQGITDFNDLANINAGGSFAGTISGQPNWSQLQTFPAGVQIGANGLRATQPVLGSSILDFRSTTPTATEIRLIPNTPLSITGVLDVFLTDATTSLGNDEFITFSGLNSGCVLVVTPCYEFQSHQTGTGTKRPLVFDMAGGTPTVVMATDGTTNFYNQPVVFTGTEVGATPFHIFENAGLLNFHNIVSPPVGSALAINQDVVETQHLVVGSVANLGGPTPQIINHMWTFTGALDSAFTSIAAQTCQEQPVTIAGVSGGVASAVSASPASNLGSVNLNWSGRVSGANTIQVRVCNPTVGALTPSSVTWAIFVAN